MTNIIDLWKYQEIRNLEKLIEDTEELIKQYDLELQELIKTKELTIKDFGYLNNKYGVKRYNQGIVQCYRKRLKALMGDSFKSKEEYYSCGIY